MNISYTEKIRKKITGFPSGGIITASMFSPSWPRNAITRALSRMVKDGSLERVKRGVYSKVKETRFGKVLSSSLEVLAREVSEDDNKCFGGLFLFNNLGLTTQVPSVIEVINNKSSYVSKYGQITIRYVKIRPKINKNTKRYISLLEVMKNTKNIPDSSTEKTFNWIKKELRGLDNRELNALVKISMEYPPRVRAILGNILSMQKKKEQALKLKKGLNGNSFYEVGLLGKMLVEVKEWRLKIETA